MSGVSLIAIPNCKIYYYYFDAKILVDVILKLVPLIFKAQLVDFQIPIKFVICPEEYGPVGPAGATPRVGWTRQGPVIIT